MFKLIRIPGYVSGRKVSKDDHVVMEIFDTREKALEAKRQLDDLNLNMRPPMESNYYID